MSNKRYIYVTWLLMLVTFVIGGCSTLTPNSSGGISEYGEGAVSILVPKYIVISQLDGREISLPREEMYILRIEPGRHILNVAYLQGWNDSSLTELVSGSRRTDRIVEWKPIDLGNDFISGEQYRIQFDEPENYKEAKSKVSSTPIWLEVGQQGRVAGNQLINDSTVSAISLDESSEGSQVRENRIHTTLVLENTDPFDKMKYWWEQSNEREKRKFLLWIYDK